MAVAAAPVLTIVNPNAPFVLAADASNEAIGAVLMQRGRPLAFESKKLDRVQRKLLGLRGGVTSDCTCA